MMNILSCDDLLTVARQQEQPQRLLFVFAAIEGVDGIRAAGDSSVRGGTAGTPVPLMCVDKAAGELANFQALVAEAAAVGCTWQLLFASSLSGRGGVAPSSADADAWLLRMVDAIKLGQLHNLLVFDRAGVTQQMQAV